ncbi:hypothetical protein Thena_1286 [Thermodesulfobium narugense DSM 14796]|uniref:Uncharacterized protein n=1 Tax=Thermodesulfobium narugense DSM 14796 TaxID=747365 RepID=M1E825_9BACT|nr:hypothetical protein [Thermodesulfobium narugense]AEE14903.1 hypothetical protein Thena_1286 [Thermodesulfobium narugense DSM 14796]
MRRIINLKNLRINFFVLFLILFSFCSILISQSFVFAEPEDNIVFRTQNGIVVVFGTASELYSLEDSYKKNEKKIDDVFDWVKKNYPTLKVERYNLYMSYKFGKWGLDLKLREAEVMGLIPDIEGLSINDARIVLEKMGFEILNNLEQIPVKKKAVFLEGTSSNDNIHIFYEGFIYQEP